MCSRIVLGWVSSSRSRSILHSGQTPPAGEQARLGRGYRLAAGAGSWRSIGVEYDLAGFPRSNQPHHLLATRTTRRGTGGRCLALGRFPLRSGGWVPGLLFGRAEQRCLAKQGPDAVGSDFGGGMQPAEGAHAGERARQDVLEKTAHELQRLQLDGGVPARVALAIVPPQFALRQELDDPVGGGGLEDVTGEVTQGVFT